MASLAIGREAAEQYFQKLLTPPKDTYESMHPSWGQLYSVLWEYNALFLKDVDRDALPRYWRLRGGARPRR